MANKVKSKGTALLMEISAVYTAIPLLKSISISGEKSTTYDSTVLDGPVHMTKDPTGYSESPSIAADGFYDPDDAAQQAYIALIAAPVETNFKVTYVDSTPTSAVYACTGFGFDRTAAMTDGLACSYSIETSGTPT